MNEIKKSSEIIENIELVKWVAENLPIRFLGDPVLTSACEPITAEELENGTTTKIVHLLVQTLTAFRQRTGLGRGLAANQVGILKRVIVLWLHDQAEVFINPEISNLTGKGSYWESCISAGSLIVGEVIRPWKGTFKYIDLKGKEQTLMADEKQTRLLLNEIDHLNGELCVHKYEPKTLRFVAGGKEEILSYPFKEIT